MKLLNFDFNKNSVTTFIEKDGSIWFVASEVCKILEHSNTSQMVRDNCDRKGVRTTDTLTAGGKQNFLIINEPNLYRLIFKSRKKEAKHFQDWVMEDVLPELRKTGRYSIPEKLKKDSTKSRNLLTSEWKRHGIENPSEYIKLTLQEYRSLNIKDGKRKKDFDYYDMLRLNALESMESLKLFSSEISGLDECSDSLENTASMVKQLQESN